MLMWSDLIGVLGRQIMSGEFINVSQKLNELPIIDSSVLGDRDYYYFYRSGVLILLEDSLISQISLYMQASEGFSVYAGELPLPAYGCESDFIQLFGTPSATGGGRGDALLGYIERWIKYRVDNYILHLQFDRSDQLSRVTLMQ